MDTRLPLLLACSLPVFASGQTILVENEFTHALGDDVFGYAWAEFDMGMVWNEGNQQTTEDGGRVEFAFDSTAAGGWFGGAVGVYFYIDATPEDMMLADLALTADISAIGGLNSGNGSVRILVVFEDSSRDGSPVLLQLHSNPIAVGEAITTVTFPDLSELSFQPNDEIPLTVADMQATAAHALQLDGILVWLEVDNGPGAFGNSANNSIRLHNVQLSTSLSLPEPEPEPEPEPIGAGDYPFELDHFEPEQTLGWTTSWLGWVWLDFDRHPWLYSEELGWIAFSGTEENLYLYQISSEEWWYTYNTLFPFAFNLTLEQWWHHPSGPVAVD